MNKLLASAAISFVLALGACDEASLAENAAVFDANRKEVFQTALPLCLRSAERGSKLSESEMISSGFRRAPFSLIGDEYALKRIGSFRAESAGCVVSTPGGRRDFGEAVLELPALLAAQGYTQSGPAPRGTYFSKGRTRLEVRITWASSSANSTIIVEIDGG
ncbi:MAG: hypothetical protein AAGF60_05180 [Pseudomonadota bacterium]